MPDTTAYWPSDTERGDAVTVTQADGFVVVSWWRDPASIKPPHAGRYEYEHFSDLNEAYEHYAACEDGEYRGWSEVGIFPVKNGLPFGPPLPLSQIAACVREGKQSARDDAEHARLFSRPSL